MKLNVSSIQHFSTGDGPGIRTTVFLKGCNLHCPWCHNPETISPKPTVLHYPSGDVTNGAYMDTEDIINEVLEDIDFYEDIGGVTISGGEPMLQADGVAYLLEKLKQNGIHTIIDTAASVPYSHFEKLLKYTDIFFFDFKAADEESYGLAGGDFKLICSNLEALITAGARVRVRIPLIPGFNTSDEYSAKMCNTLLRLGAKDVDLLPFHRLASGKYEALNLKYSYKDTEPMTIAEAKLIAKNYEPYFNVNIEK